MSACKILVRTSLSCLECGVFRVNSNRPAFASLPVQRFLHSSSSLPSPRLCCSPLLSRTRTPKFGLKSYGPTSRRQYGSIAGAAAVSLDAAADGAEETLGAQDLTLESQEEDTISKDIFRELLSGNDNVARLMKMERRTDVQTDQLAQPNNRWFPYLNEYKAGSSGMLSSGEVLEAMDPHIMDVRKERFKNVVKNRSYSVCLVVEGLCDFGNVSATFRSADALGFQSVHVVACDNKRYRDNRHVSMGAEKWLDIELWNSTRECFEILKSRGYRIATTHLGMDTVSIHNMDWSCPTAIVVGNENRGISDEALELSDLHCSIPMQGMVDSFNVSVAAGILMHHAVCDRTSRLGRHGDLTLEESQILLAEFSLRHSKSAVSIAHEYAKRKLAGPIPKL